MVNKECKDLAHDLVRKAKEKGLITKYSDFCKTELSNEFAIDDEKIEHYKEIKEALEEVKMIKQGKINPKTWEEFKEELKQENEWEKLCNECYSATTKNNWKKEDSRKLLKEIRKENRDRKQ